MQISSANSASSSSMDRVSRRPWWKRRRALAGGGLAVLAAGLILWIVLLPPPGSVTVSVTSLDIGEAARGSFQDYLPLRAEIIPETTVLVAADAMGRVAVIDVADGSPVKKGQVLAKLANADLTLQVSSQEVEIDSRLADVSQQLMTLKKAEEQSDRDIAEATYALHKAQQELAKRQFLLSAGILNEMAVKPYADEVTYQMERLAKLKETQSRDRAGNAAQRRQIETTGRDLSRNLENVRAGLDALLVTAPADGRLTDFLVKPGQPVKSGDTLGEVDSEDRVKLKADIDEFYLSRLKTGLSGTARIRDQAVRLTVSRVFPQVTNGRVVIELEFADAMPVGMKRGEAVDVRLSLGDTRDALMVPAGAWLGEDGGASIFLLDGDRRADRRRVSIGRRNLDHVEILDGLKPGDRVVVSGPKDLSKATHLRIEEQK